MQFFINNYAFDGIPLYCFLFPNESIFHHCFSVKIIYIQLTIYLLAIETVCSYIAF